MTDDATTDALVDAFLDERPTNFQRSRPLRIAAVATLAVVVAMWAAIASAETFALQPGAHDPSVKPATKLQPPRDGRLVSLKQMNLPGVDGTTIRTRKHWKWSFLDNCVDTVHKAGDKWTWLPCGGDEQNPLSAANLAAREKLYRDGAARYAKDPSLTDVHAFVSPYSRSEEGFWGKKMPPEAKAAQKRFILLCATLFPTQRIIWTGSAEDPAANREIIAYGVKVAPGRFGYKMNAMNPKDNFGWSGTSLLIDAAKMGANICFEAVQPSKHQDFGGTWPQFVAKVKEVERRAGKRFTYKAIYPEDLARAGDLK